MHIVHISFRHSRFRCHCWLTFLESVRAVPFASVRYGAVQFRVNPLPSSRGTVVLPRNFLPDMKYGEIWGWLPLIAVGILFLAWFVECCVLHRYCAPRVQSRGRLRLPMGMGLPRVPNAHSELPTPQIHRFAPRPGMADNVCGICLDTLAPAAGDVAKGAMCEHHFHANCVQQWLVKDHARSCPTCRAPFLDHSQYHGVLSQLRGNNNHYQQEQPQQHGFVTVPIPI